MSLRNDGPNLTIPGAPFQAERVTKTVQRLADGSSIVHEMHERIGRDAAGRCFDEAFAPPAPGEAEHPFHMLADPVGQRIVTWGYAAKFAMANPVRPSTNHVQFMVLPMAPAQAQFPKDKAATTTEQLGTKTVAGMLATGTRTTTTLPAGAMGNEKPLQHSEEVWIAKDLQIVVEESDTSSISGTRTVALLSLERTEPLASRFEIPAGVEIRQSPSAQGLAGLLGHPESPVYQQALADLAKPETQQKAAVQLIEYARTHPEVANHVAHALASKHTHLDEAEELGQASVARVEQASSVTDLEQTRVIDVLRMNELAEYWDSLGWVHWVRGDETAAKKYCRMAWELGGEGLYMDHLARIAMEDGETEPARHMLQVALSGKMDDREHGQVLGDLAKLGVDKPEMIDEPPTVMLPGAYARAGTADFWLLFAADAPPRVKFASGSDNLALLGPVIAAAKFPAQLPDNGPEHVVRRAHVLCGQKGCKLTLLYAYKLLPHPAVKAPVTKP